MVNKRLIEKKVWKTTEAFLDLPPTSVNGTRSLEGRRKYMAARRAIQQAVDDPVFVARFQRNQVELKELLFKSFPPKVFSKLLETDICALVPEKK